MNRIVMVAILLLGCAASAFCQDAGIAAGSFVAAKWSDGSWYRGKVTAVASGKYSVAYDDGDSSVLERKDLRLLPARPKVAKGQAVFALWDDDGTFYLGTVNQVTAKGILVAWDDGSESSEVAFGYFATDVQGLSAAGSSAAAAGSAGPAKTVVLWSGGSRVGEVEPTGKIRIGGSVVGEIEADGSVWQNGSKVGEIDGATIWEAGSRAGEVDAAGKVWKDGSLVGEIGGTGKVWKDGSVVGEAQGLPRAWAAAIWFFFPFLEE